MKAVDLLHKEMKEGIKKVLSGKLEKYEAENITPIMVAEFMSAQGYEKGELDTNGWQYDWWLPFTKNGKSFTASGGGYYGNFEFGPTEE